MAVPKVYLEVTNQVAVEGGADATLRIVASSITEVAYSVNYVATGASSGTDYTSIGTSESMEDIKEKTITVEALGTSADESDKWLVVTLLPSDDYEIIAPHTGAVLLTYLKDTIAVLLNAASIGEEASGTAPFVGARRLTSGQVYPINISLSQAAPVGGATIDVNATIDTTGDSATTGAGLAFTNQPANDGIEVLSSDAGDTTQTVTLIGTTTGTDTVVVETVTLNGLTFVPTVKTNWGALLAVKLSAAAAGTVTVREASGDATIAQLTPGQTSLGVETVSLATDHYRPALLVGSGATTKQIGLKGTSSTGATQYDSQALTGATEVLGNSSFLTITEIYTGDLEGTRTVTASLPNVGAEFGVDFELKNCPGTSAGFPQTIYFVEGEQTKLLFLEILNGGNAPELNLTLLLETPTGTGVELGTTVSQTFRLYEAP